MRRINNPHTKNKERKRICGREIGLHARIYSLALHQGRSLSLNRLYFYGPRTTGFQEAGMVFQCHRMCFPCSAGSFLLRGDQLNSSAYVERRRTNSASCFYQRRGVLGTPDICAKTQAGDSPESGPFRSECADRVKTRAECDRL